MTGNALYFFDCRVRESRMLFYRKFREPRLYKLAKKFDFERIIERCRSLPAIAAKEARFQHEYPPQQTALHLVLEPLFLLDLPTDEESSKEMQSLRHEAAAALLEANKDAATLCCSLGTSPTTLVCIDPYAYLPGELR